MRLVRHVVLVWVLAVGLSAQEIERSEQAIVLNAQKAAVAALNFNLGDADGFNHARADFTSEGWKDFLKQMEGFLDAKGAPKFTSSFVPLRDATVLDSKNGVVHFRVPGTLKQSNKMGATTYRAAIEVFASANSEGDRRPIKIQRMEQIACVGTHNACE